MKIVIIGLDYVGLSRLRVFYYWLTEVGALLGDPTKAKDQLGLDTENHPKRDGARDDRKRPKYSQTRRTNKTTRLQNLRLQWITEMIHQEIGFTSSSVCYVAKEWNFL